MLMKERMKMMLALWRLWHQFQLFLVLQIRLLLNWRRFGFLRPFLAFWLIASAWDSNDWTKARLRDGKYDILEGFFYSEEIFSFWGYFFFIWRRSAPFWDVFLDLEDICFFFWDIFLYLEDTCFSLGYFLVIWRRYAPFGDIFSLFGGDICSRISGIEICHLRKSRGGNALLPQK